MTIVSWGSVVRSLSVELGGSSHRMGFARYLGQQGGKISAWGSRFRVPMCTWILKNACSSTKLVYQRHIQALFFSLQLTESFDSRTQRLNFPRLLHLCQKLRQMLWMKKRQLCRYVWAYVNKAVMMLVNLLVCFAQQIAFVTPANSSISNISASQPPSQSQSGRFISFVSCTGVPMNSNMISV